MKTAPTPRTGLFVLNPLHALDARNFLIFLIVLTLIVSCSKKDDLPIILYPSGSDAKVELAAKEVRRYMYLRTGELLPMQVYTGQELPKKVIWLMVKGQQAPGNLISADGLTSINNLASESYLLSSSAVIPAKAGTPSQTAKSDRLVIAGGDAMGTLYGAYAFAEKLGVRFYLHGDVIPDQQIKPDIPVMDETGTPLFETRGIQPFHDFPEGPDWWTLQDYKAYFSQMVKMKMNFFGLHTYPEGGVGPEPLVWIGTNDQLNDNGTVKSAYQSRHFTTTSGTWAYTAKLTKDYSHQLGRLFENDSYGTDYMIGTNGWPAGEQAEIDLFNKSAKFFGEAFGFAKSLGLKTCVGTETPLTVPKRVKERNPSAKTLEYYTGMFQWIKRNYPVDYYWFWTPEDWTWSGNTKEHLQLTIDDLKAAQEAVAAVGNPFQLATCGWVLGPAQDRSMFDQFLPKSWPMSCINQQVGFTPVDPGFAKVTGRPLWAIPWMEDDPALTSMQLWAGRMRADAADALAYGCTGLIGIHWRTKTLQTTVSALAQAGWSVVMRDTKRVTRNTESVTLHESRVTSSEADSNFMRKTRDLPVGDFYADWALAQFGSGVADSMTKILTDLDGQEVSINKGGGKKTRLPRQGDWTGPGGVIIDTLSWENRAPDYAFIERIESWRGQVRTAGNLERFDYWLNFFKYHRAFGKFACTLGETERLLKKLEKAGQADAGSYADQFISQRIKLMEVINEALGYLLAYASTPGDLGTIANWEQHLLTYNVDGQAARIEKLTGRKLPPEALPSGESLKIKKLMVPTVRTILEQGENLEVTMIVYGFVPKDALLNFKPLGNPNYNNVPFKLVKNGVYKAIIPASQITGDFEYHIVTGESDPTISKWPVTTGKMNQTVVIVSASRR
ncbi:MAG: hypothetical protein D4R64_17370 [Porphyromonadaceae bacterium]|nr:MAG: hypothetical protein D4R64_17370 [Porphyromonadaceae bacterium]